MDEVKKAVDTNLEDLSVSRPSQRLTWGIPVPTDDTQTIYVWLDALINYITKAGYPWPPDQLHAGGWPADCHIIGKDIIRFHCIYWPAFLMALNLPLPRQILAHSHWTLGREKMSKSTGNVVNPFFAVDRFGTDLIRFYLAHDGGIKQDADYGNEFVVERYEKALQGGLGNLSSRLLRGKGWNVRRAIETRRGQSPRDTLDEMQHTLLSETPGLVAKDMEGLNASAALKRIMSMVFKVGRKPMTFNINHLNELILS